ncbi:uncharacterized protein LOC142567726 [Dermacentor variabilis]|uniref:uncharacterized protein LOC142567726 n=1 Tax=Dermacentor variabilis TaxID=34621 RepID=UPI003F5BF6E7
MVFTFAFIRIGYGRIDEGWKASQQIAVVHSPVRAVQILRQQPLEDAACRAAAEYARQGQLAEAANAEAASFHQLLLQQNRQHHQQLVEELRATRVVRQQLAAEMRGLREATGLIATTLRQLLAALARLREHPQP